MDWNASTWWWVVAGALVAAELATGTFYLLMLALGAGASAIAAQLGLGMVGQLLAGAAVGGGAVAAWHLRPSRPAGNIDPAANRDINLDIGSIVNVNQWHADRLARVSYRGAAWDVRFTGAGEPSPGPHVIRAVEGNRLLLDRAEP